MIRMNRIIQLCKQNYFLLSAPLIFLSFPSYDVWILKGFPFFAWISLVPVFLYVKGKGFKDAYLVSFLTGLAGNLLTYEWIGNFGAAMPGGYFIIVIMLNLSLSVFFAVKITAAELLSQRHERFRALIFPSVWIIVDWIQSIGFLAFPWTYWGHSQYPFTPFIQMASVTGILGINFVVILFNYLFSEFVGAGGLRRRPLGSLVSLKEAKRVAAAAVFVLAVTLCGAVILAVSGRGDKKDLRVAMVQSCISPWENWSENRFRYLAELKRYTEQALADNPEFIIWSESATLETISYSYETGMLNDFEKEVLALAQTADRPLLTGEIGVVEDFRRFGLSRYPQNNAVLINNLGEVVRTYPKINLVPFGEWFPYEKWFPAVKQLTERMGGSSFVPGTQPVMFDVRGHRFGVLICYEGIFYRLCRSYRRLGAEFLVNITNDGWTRTYRGHMQHFSASIFRAVENGVWYVRAGNTGYTAIIDPYGRVRESFPILTKGYLAGDIDFSLDHRTVYTAAGDIILYLAMAFLCVLAGITLYKSIHERIINPKAPSPSRGEGRGGGEQA